MVEILTPRARPIVGLTLRVRRGAALWIGIGQGGGKLEND